ncbi:MAG: hypothetical protein BWY85_02272 [Firmicutes bacterium ADurb.Bin506]|nr:MAG: hypothetical protein BWY85_02272 [Firmicutes bacterium ADurb.Bin506]
MADARAPDDEDHVVANALGFGEIHQCCQVGDVHVLLRNHLRHQHGVGAKSDSLGNKRFIGNLGSEVVRFEAGVALQTRLAGKALHVHDRIDSDGMRVGAGARRHHDYLAVEVRPHELVQLIKPHGVNGYARH